MLVLSGVAVIALGFLLRFNPLLVIVVAALVTGLAAATDNIGLFFGEDIFIAIGSILLMKGVLEGYGIFVEPLHMSIWAIPTAVAAFAIHGGRMWWLDRKKRIGVRAA